MSSSFLEIVELPNGEIVLQRAGEEGEPLVNIRFSEESLAYITDSYLDIAKVMIQAGIQAVAHLNEESLREDLAEDELRGEEQGAVKETGDDTIRTLH